MTIRMYPGRDTGINPMMTHATATTMKRSDIGLRAVTLLNGKPAIPARTVTVISSESGRAANMDRYRANWESLKTHRVPAWFDNAKLGIFIHWGGLFGAGVRASCRRTGNHTGRRMVRSESIRRMVLQLRQCRARADLRAPYQDLRQGLSLL